MWLCELAWGFLDCCASSIVVGDRGAKRPEVVGEANVKFVCFYSQQIEVVCETKTWSESRQWVHHTKHDLNPC